VSKRIAVGLVAAVVVIAAVALVVVRQVAADDTPDWSAVPAVQPKIPRSEDPSDAQVWAKLGQLDPCYLAGGTRRASNEALSLSPAECKASGLPTEGIVPGRLTVDVGVEYGLADLYVRRRVQVAGFSVWYGSGGQTMTTAGTGCVVLVPANDHLALRFRSTQADCQGVLARVRQVVGKLASDPHAFDVAKPRPSACQALSWALPQAAVRGVADNCSSGKGASYAGVRLTTAGVVEGTPVQIGQISALQSKETGKATRCAVEWAIGPASGNGSAGTTNRLTLSAAGGCARARTLAQRIIDTARNWRPPQPAQPLFYRYTAPDPTGTGACRDLYDQQDRKCVPAAKATVPGDPVEFLRHGEADPAVVCAAAEEALAASDVQMEAVTALDQDPELGDDPRMCVLVDASHSVEIEIRASRKPLGAGATGKIAGHSVIHKGAPLPGYAIALGSPSSRGSLHLEARVPTSGELAEPDWLRGFVVDLVRQRL